MLSDPSDLISGDALKRAAAELIAQRQAKIKDQQRGVPTFFENFLLRTIRQLRQLDLLRPWEESCAALGGAEGERLRAGLLRLRRYLTRTQCGRFVDRQDRLAAGAMPRSEIDGACLAMSQGTGECLTWKGLPLFKSAFDLALYPMMLWEAKPRTVIELGSGLGSSAVWLADHLRVFGIEGQVISLDLEVPAIACEGVTFRAGDCTQIAEALPGEEIEHWPHPWLVIEDAHVNVLEVLSHLHRFTQGGDYLVVEDSTIKTEALDAFTARFPGAYKLDTRYSDFFGRNATTCFDSIFRRV